VPSVRCQAQKTTATAIAKAAVVAQYGTPSWMWMASAHIVPNTATMVTASQYTAGM
jgi:hypothetical protein